MKAFFLVILIAACELAFSLSPGAPGAWFIIEPSAFESDPTIQQALTFGANDVIRRGIEANRLKNVDYDIARIYRISQQVVEGLNYRYLVAVKGEDGSVTLISYIVYFQPDGVLRVLSWNYYTVRPGQNVEAELGEIGEYEWSEEDIYAEEELAL